MTRRRKFPEPVGQWWCPQGWSLSRYPQVPDAYYVMYRGQHVGWLIIAANGWHWHTPDPRCSWARSITSRVVFDSWESAATGIAGTAWARLIAGGRVRPQEWRRASTLPAGRRPWTPRTAPGAQAVAS